jgi:hypothetical protein
LLLTFFESPFDLRRSRGAVVVIEDLLSRIRRNEMLTVNLSSGCRPNFRPRHQVEQRLCQSIEERKRGIYAIF